MDTADRAGTRFSDANKALAVAEVAFEQAAVAAAA